MVPLMLTLILTRFLGNFWGQNGLILGWGKARKIFRGLLIHMNNFCFLNIALFLLYLPFIYFSTDRQTDGWIDKGTYRSSPRSLKIMMVHSFAYPLYLYLYRLIPITLVSIFDNISDER